MCVACIAEWEAARRAREEGGEDAVALRLRRADDDKRRKMAEFDDKARASRALADEMGAREAALRERQANAELAREQALQQLYDMNRAKAAAYNQGMRAVYTQYIIIIIIVFIYHTRTDWWRGTVVERRSLAGELSLSCARPAADG